MPRLIRYLEPALSFDPAAGSTPAADSRTGHEVHVELFLPILPGANEAARAENRRLRRLADYDDLTQVLNRRAFIEQCGLLLSETGGALLVLDLDRFKQFNDRYGHVAGDTALTHTAQVMRSCLGADQLLGRLGGEEFGIALVGTTPNQAREIAETIRLAIEENPVDLDGMELPSTASIGVHNIEPNDSLDVSGWLRGADKLLYAAKRLGRNMVVATGEVETIEKSNSQASTFRAIVSGLSLIHI